MKEFDPSLIRTLFPPTHINDAPHEDSDWLEVTAPTEVYPIGDQVNGAIPILLIQDGQLLTNQVFYWHQPEVILPRVTGIKK